MQLSGYFSLTLSLKNQIKEIMIDLRNMTHITKIEIMCNRTVLYCQTLVRDLKARSLNLVLISSNQFM